MGLGPFTPTYETDVFITEPDGTKVPVNPIYCATEPTQTFIFGECQFLGFIPELFMDNPFGGNMGGGFAASKQVPWIKITNPETGVQTIANVGVLSDYWNPTHGYPFTYAQNKFWADLKERTAAPAV